MPNGQVLRGAYQATAEPEIPLIRIVGPAARPAGWPVSLIGFPALVAALYGSRRARLVGAVALAGLALLWFSGRWPAEREART